MTPCAETGRAPRRCQCIEATGRRCNAAICRVPSRSGAPALSITSSAAARRCARLACAARIVSTRSRVNPLRRMTRSICTSSGQSTTSTRSTAGAPVAGLDQQRHRRDHIRTGGGADACRRGVADHRVQDGFELLARGRIRECAARASRRDPGCRRRGDQPRRRTARIAGDRGAAGAGQFVGDRVGIDDAGAARGEQVGDRALAAADAAGQADGEDARAASGRDASRSSAWDAAIALRSSAQRRRRGRGHAEQPAISGLPKYSASRPAPAR